MSKQQPNQGFYKIGGREQSDGPDKAVVDERHRHEFAAAEKKSKKNFIPGEAPAGEKSKK